MEPSLPTVKRLFALSSNKCAYPDCSAPIVEDSGIVTGTICHIKAKRKKGPRFDSKQTELERHHYDNLVLMCARHSKVIDADPARYTVAILLDYKKNHELPGIADLSRKDSLAAEALLKDYRDLYIYADQVMVNSPGSVQGKNITFRTVKEYIRLLPPEGSIGSSRVCKAYIHHLIKRYHEFAKGLPGRKFEYSVIYKNIESKFGMNWDLVSITKFPDLVSYLQGRINRTRLGKTNKSKGYPNFSDFEEYILKYDT